MKKKITVCLFLALILATAIHCIVSAVESYRYDMDPNNGIDIFEGLGAALAILVGGFVVLYELDLFYTVYYFCWGKKTNVKSILNVAANLCFLSAQVSLALLDRFGGFKTSEAVAIVFFIAYIALRLLYCGFSVYLAVNQEEQVV